MSRVSLLFDARLALEKPTGIGRYVTSLVPELIRLAPEWHFHLLRRPDPWPEYGIDGWRAPNLTQHVSRVRHMSLRQHISVPRLASRLGVNLIHYPHFDAPVLFGDIPLVATVHDAKYLVRAELGQELGRLKRSYMRASYKRTLRLAARVIVDSAHTADDLKRMFAVASDRLAVVRLAADPSFKPQREEDIRQIRAKYGLSLPFILSVGERRLHKNYVRLIEAYAQSRSCASHQLVIVGRRHGGYDDPEKTARRLGISHPVRFLDNVPAADLVVFYAAAELFVLVSLYEGFGLPVLEAMACGTPVVASATTATGEILGSGGISVDPHLPEKIAEAIDEVMGNPERQTELVRLGRQRVVQFSWEQTARETIAVYGAALGAQ